MDVVMDNQNPPHAAVQLDNVSFSFIPGGRETLQGLSLMLPAGSRCVLVGQNGAGKSTLLEIIAGNKMVPSKQVLLCGEDPFRGSSGKKVALVQGGWRGFGTGQGEERVSFMRVWELLGIADPRANALPAADYSIRLLDALLLKPLLLRYFGSLSDGERRRVELGRKLWESKSVVLLDEATTDLDLLARQRLMRFLEAERVTVMNATHVFDGLERWATHIVHLHEGRIVRTAEMPPGGAFFQDEKHGLFGLVTRWLQEVTSSASPAAAPATAAEDQLCGSTIAVRSLRFSYAPGSPCALCLSHMDLPRGCRCVLVGLNGSGKSTLLAVLAGRRMVPDVEVQVLGFRAFHDHTALDKLVAILSSEWKKQVAEISAGKAVAFAALATALITELVSAGMDQAMLAGRMLRLIQMLGIDPTKPIGALSDGMMRRVQIALKLLRPSKVLLVDEVTADLDVLGRAALLEFLKEESIAGCSVLYCTHIFDGLDGWATHILRLRPGGHDGQSSSWGEESSVTGSELEEKPTCNRLIDNVFDMLTEDSQLEPLVGAEPEPPVRQSAEAELPLGWASRGATQAGAFGDYAWNADKGSEETWSFASVAPKPHNSSGTGPQSSPGGPPAGMPGFSQHASAMGQFSMPGALPGVPGAMWQQSQSGVFANGPGAMWPQPNAAAFPGATAGMLPQFQAGYASGHEQNFTNGQLPQPSTISGGSLPPSQCATDSRQATSATTTSRDQGLPSGWGSRSNQVPLQELIHRGVVQPERSSPPSYG